MAVALRGNLQDFGIADVFQLIGQQRKTGVLEFTGDNAHVQLRFDRGAVVSAAPVGARAEEALADMLVRCGRLSRAQVDRLAPECDASAQTVPRLAVARGLIEPEDLERIEDLLTRETFFDVLRWKSGAFDFRAVSVDHSRRFEALLGAEQILMDGLRMIDEWQSFSELVPSEQTVFQRSSGFEDYRGRTSVSDDDLEGAQRLFQLVDGRMPVRRLVDLSLLGTFDAYRLLADLRRAGAIEPVGEDVLRRLSERRGRRAAVDPAQARAWIAGFLSLALLAGTAALAWRGLPANAPASGFDLGRGGFARIEAAYAARRVRNALETHRFRTGRWPEHLAGLEAEGLLPEGALASAETRPYYYERRDDGVLLLAPER